MTRMTLAQAEKAMRTPRADPAAATKSKSAPAPAAKPVKNSGAGEVRIIGGQWKRTRLPVAQRPGLRPTPDRVRETLFNWLGHDLAGWRCFDAFAGTGALGLEAASRGAAAVQLVENDTALVTQLQALCHRLQAANVQVRKGDALALLRHCAPASCDLVLLDPPFDSPLFEPALEAAARAVTPNGFVYLEAAHAWSDEALAPLGLVRQRYLRAGAVHAHLLRLAP